MMIKFEEAVEFFAQNDNFLLLCHISPDGDTVGSATALARALISKGKKVNIRCGDRFNKDYDMLFEGLELSDIEPEHVVAVDVADPRLLGSEIQGAFGDRIELCIDHHASNVFFARKTYLEPDSASAAEIIYNIIIAIGVEITSDIATCLFTGVSTDTGHFRFGNTTVRTFEIAAELAAAGAETFKIVQIFFETKKKPLVELERLALSDMRYYFSGKCALMCITKDMFEKSGADESDAARLVNYTRQVEGVLVGVMLKEQNDGSFKVSLRTNGELDASSICSRLGGGGHSGAAACTLTGKKQAVINTVLKEIEAELKA